MKKSFILVLSLVCLFSCRIKEEAKSSQTEQAPAPLQSAVQPPARYELTAEDKNLLLKIARDTVERWVRDKVQPEFNIGAEQKIMNAPGAAFVTLREDGKLRGCIGHTIAQEPLWMCVRDVAMAAATEDRRFTPVTPEELKKIHVEVSVLTPLERVPNADAVVLGRDGVIVKKGPNMGVFLPQVATETGWDKGTFLSQLCWQKAFLPANCWQDSATEIYTFQAIVFEEPK